MSLSYLNHSYKWDWLHSWQQDNYHNQKQKPEQEQYISSREKTFPKNQYAYFRDSSREDPEQ